eukprot:6265168-Karenia_brevis.AAC.1
MSRTPVRGLGRSHGAYVPLGQRSRLEYHASGDPMLEPSSRTRCRLQPHDGQSLDTAQAMQDRC